MKILVNPNYDINIKDDEVKILPINEDLKFKLGNYKGYNS